METSPTCAVCGAPNPPNRATCSKVCRYELVRRKHRAAGIRPPGLTPDQQNAARERVRGENAPWWKGGRNLTDKGYVMVLAPAGYLFPQSLNRYGRIREHRMVMELHLGRALDPREVVHHRNGDRTDNQIDNLELAESHSAHMREHAGTSADTIRRVSAATRSTIATCRTCSAEYRTNARSTGECAPCRTRGYEAKRRRA